jgi:hypothetical protein
LVVGGSLQVSPASLCLFTLSDLGIPYRGPAPADGGSAPGVSDPFRGRARARPCAQWPDCRQAAVACPAARVWSAIIAAAIR